MTVFAVSRIQYQEQHCSVCCQQNIRNSKAMFAASRMLGAGKQSVLPVEYQEQESSVCCQYNIRNSVCCHGSRMLGAVRKCVLPVQYCKRQQDAGRKTERCCQQEAVGKRQGSASRSLGAECMVQLVECWEQEDMALSEGCQNIPVKEGIVLLK